MSKRKDYPIRIPRHARGIRAQETRVGATRCWWARAWGEAVERMAAGPRLGRGRNYALSGQVTRLAIADGAVEATVVGARPAPYGVRIAFRKPKGAVRARILAALRSEPMTVARILAGDLPLAVREIFRSEGYDLFPGERLAPGKYDATTSCTCPDYANPCKHTVAVLLLLGEEVARRPSLLLELRGISEEDLGED